MQAMSAEPGDDSPAGGGDGRAGLAGPGGSPHLDAWSRMGGDGGGERGQVFGSEAVGADDSREGGGFQCNHGIDDGLVRDQHRAGGQRTGVDGTV